MKKQLMSGLFAAGLLFAATSNSMANGTPAPVEPAAAESGLEISGNVTTLVGWQHDDKDAGVFPGVARLGGFGDIDTLGNSDMAAAQAGDRDHFRFLVDQVEIDLQKSFGENIRLRADLDFGDFGNTGNRTGNVASVSDFFDLEQAYVTANLAAGNGIEFLIGKFNAPVGVESVDRNENWLISYASPFRFVTPTNVTGAKLYYAFSDLVDLHVAVVNDLNSNGFATDSAIPSALFRLGFNWGEEGRENTIGISGGAGPERVNQNAHFDFFGDLDMMLALTDSVSLAAEGVYRQSDQLFGVTTRNQKIIAGFTALNFQASDVWDVTLRGDFAWDMNPVNAILGGAGASNNPGSNYIGYEGMLISGALGTGYQITDGAKMKLEYRFDWARTSGPLNDSDYHSVLAEFAYTF